MDLNKIIIKYKYKNVLNKLFNMEENIQNIIRISNLSNINSLFPDKTENEINKINNLSYLLLSYNNGNDIKINYIQTIKELIDKIINNVKDNVIGDLSSVIESYNQIDDNIDESSITNLNDLLLSIPELYKSLLNKINSLEENDNKLEYQQNSLNNKNQEISKQLSILGKELTNSYNELTTNIVNLNNILTNTTDKFENDIENLNSKIDQFINQEYISKTYFEKTITQITNQYNRQLEEMFNSIKLLITESNNSSEYIESEIDKIKNEIVNNQNGIDNTRIDNLELSYSKLDSDIKDIKHNGNISVDYIDKIIWEDYQITSELKSKYISGETFTIDKGKVTLYYNDGTEPEDITSKAIFNIFGGTLNGNIVTTGNRSGNYHISVNYNNHEAINRDNSPAKISFEVIYPIYNNYLWFVDGFNLNKIINQNRQFTENCIDYSIQSSTINQCPMVEGNKYIINQILIDKFNNYDENSGLYMIIPSEYISIQNNISLYINGKPLKSNILDIEIIGKEYELIMNTKSSNVSTQPTKPISYSVIYITDSQINKGIQLNY